MIFLYLLLAVIAVIAVLLLVCLVRACINRKSVPETPLVRKENPDAMRIAGKLSKMVQVNTVVLPGEDNPHQFDPMIETLSQLFPNVFEKFQRMDYLDNNLLLKWDSGNHDKEGILFMGHMDVVDAAGKWSHDPFGGEIIDDVLWGRGSIDIKSGLCGFFEAFEQLIAEGMTPNRDLYIFCSRTEENSGPGAQMAVDYLHDHGVHLEMVLDEGCSIGESPMDGVRRPYALIGLGEKGYINIKFTARSNGGHSSEPPHVSTIGRLSKFIARIEKKSPFKCKMDPTTRRMLETFAPEMPLKQRFVYGNLWLFTPILEKIYRYKDGFKGAMLKTTAAFTIIEGAHAANILPDAAYVICNLRLSPHDTVENVVSTMKAIASRYGLETELMGGRGASEITPLGSVPYLAIEKAVHKHFPEVGVTPYLILGGTDARHFTKVCDNVLRFVPHALTNEEVGTVHGRNEHISIHALANEVPCYKDIILELNL